MSPEGPPGGRARRLAVRLLIAVAVGAVLAVVLPGCVREWLYERLPQPVLPETPTSIPGFGTMSAADCGACHTAIYTEWRGSRMAESFRDPVFQGDYRNQHELYACLYCHTPLYEQRAERITGLDGLRPIHGGGEPNPAHLPALQDDGVTCLACHARHGEDGTAAIAGPFALQAPHPTVADADFAGPQRCVGCHELKEPPLSDLDRPIADTRAEWETWKAKTGRTETCAGCHMPSITRPLVDGYPAREGRQHTFLGGWSDELVRAALEVSRAEDGTLTISNRAGHAFPTAEPARALEVRWEAVKDGAVVATAEAWIQRLVKQPRLVDLGDTSLLPAETRVLTPSWTRSGDTEGAGARAARAALPPGSTIRVRVVFHRLQNLPELIPLSDRPVECVVWEG